jgi:hypothetical protein
MEQDTALKQKKIALAQSEHAGTVIELMKDCFTQVPLVADTEWKTIVNAVTLDVQGTMLKNMVDHIDKIKNGSLHEEQ